MPEKQQIMPVSLAVACETYSCHKKVAWAIGRPDGPRPLWNYYCDSCMRDIIASIPVELMPEKEPNNLIVTIREQLEADNLSYEDVKAILDIFVNRGLLDKAVEQEGQEETKTYACKYCGESFNNPGALGNHVKRCEARKEAING